MEREFTSESNPMGKTINEKMQKKQKTTLIYHVPTQYRHSRENSYLPYIGLLLTSLNPVLGRLLLGSDRLKLRSQRVDLGLARLSPMPLSLKPVLARLPLLLLRRKLTPSRLIPMPIRHQPLFPSLLLVLLVLGMEPVSDRMELINLRKELINLRMNKE